MSLTVVVLALTGCGGPGDQGSPAPEVSETTFNEPPDSRQPTHVPTARTQPAAVDQQPNHTPAAEKKPPTPEKTEWERHPEHRSLADLLTEEDLSGGDQFRSEPPPRGEQFFRPPMEIDDRQVAAAGVRKLQSKHLTLYTDIPSSPAVDELPQVFDLALPQWCDYFQLDPAAQEDFHLTGFVIRDRPLFRRVGLLPDDLPPFLHGYSRDYEFWVYDQESDYYRRHLVIHEGTHGIMNLALGGYGPPWYSEGMAEMFGTHLWKDGKLTTRYFPQTKEEVPYWGRIKIIKDEFAANRGMPLPQIMQYGPRAHLNKEPYAWCWAATMFLDRHPLSRDKFRRMKSQTHDYSMDFSRRLYNELTDVWPELYEQWQLFLANMEYGYDIDREVVQYKRGEPLPAAGATVTVAADRGWQSTGIRLEAGTRYAITATGRYQVADEPQIWWCEPNGVTIRYWKGKPLGVLLGALRDDAVDLNKPTGLVAQTFTVGLHRTMAAPASGTLYLRINDSPAELADNAGELTVQVLPE